MAVAHLAVTKPKLLLGEGNEEVRFFNALLKHLGIDEIQVECFGGKRNLGPFLRMAAGSHNFANIVSLGVTRDADDDSSQAFQSVCSALQQTGLTVPTATNNATSGQPVVRVFILPDNALPGMLEDLCLSSARAHPGFPCIDSYFQCMATVGRVPANPSKAQIHTWLASETQPDRRLGEAAEARYWNWTDAAFAPLIDFVKSL